VGNVETKAQRMKPLEMVKVCPRQMRYQLVRRFWGMTRGFLARRFENPLVGGAANLSRRGGVPSHPGLSPGGNGKEANS
jgi:hypothetical protein